MIGEWSATCIVIAVLVLVYKVITKPAQTNVNRTRNESIDSDRWHRMTAERVDADTPMYDLSHTLDQHAYELQRLKDKIGRKDSDNDNCKCMCCKCKGNDK